MHPTITIISVLVGFALDLLNVVLALRRSRRGRGASGLPVIPIIFYWLPAVVGYPVLSSSSLLDMGIFVAVHVILS